MITGVFCFLHAASEELQQVFHVQQLSEQLAMKRLKALAYIRHEIQNPLSGIIKMLQGTGLNEEQSRLLTTGEKCHYQLNRILEHLNLQSIMDRYVFFENLLMFRKICFVGSI